MIKRLWTNFWKEYRKAKADKKRRRAIIRRKKAIRKLWFRLLATKTPWDYLILNHKADGDCPEVKAACGCLHMWCLVDKVMEERKIPKWGRIK